jgi:hypothetical protein
MSSLNVVPVMKLTSHALDGNPATGEEDQKSLKGVEGK